MDHLVELAADIGEERVRLVLLRANALRAVSEFDRTMAARFAERLWHQRVPQREIVDRLIARYQYSERTSYRIANEGLDRFAKTRGRLARPPGMIEPGISPEDERDDA